VRECAQFGVPSRRSWRFLTLFSALSTSRPEAVACSSGSGLRITEWRCGFYFLLPRLLADRGVRWQCVDGKEVLATYEVAQLSSDYSAMLTIRQAGLAVVTEILTTLMLSQMATVLQWRG
jgi:hypothetical protein